MASHPPASSRDRIARYRTAQRERGLRPVVLWLPDVNDRTYRARLTDECQRLAQLTHEEDAIAADFACLRERTEGWR
jgi:antidote-toxin recognition MazE-like antitoxin